MIKLNKTISKYFGPSHFTMSVLTTIANRQIEKTEAPKERKPRKEKEYKYSYEYMKYTSIQRSTYPAKRPKIGKSEHNFIQNTHINSSILCFNAGDNSDKFEGSKISTVHKISRGESVVNKYKQSMMNKIDLRNEFTLDDGSVIHIQSVKIYG